MIWGYHYFRKHPFVEKHLDALEDEADSFPWPSGSFEKGDIPPHFPGGGGFPV